LGRQAPVSVPLYADEQIPADIVTGLLAGGVDVITAQQDGRTGASDTDLLDRATALGRVLVTNDRDFLVETARRQRLGIHFAGVAYAQLLRMRISQSVSSLVLLSLAADPGDQANRVE